MENKNLYNYYHRQSIELAIGVAIFVISVSTVYHLLSYPLEQIKILVVFEMFIGFVLAFSLLLLKKGLMDLNQIIFINYFLISTLIFFIKIFDINFFVAIWYPPIVMSAVILGSSFIGMFAFLYSLLLANIAYHDSSFQVLFSINVAIIFSALFGKAIHNQINRFLIENEKIKNHFYDLSTTDFLTTLYNRRYFKNECEKLLEMAKRKGGSVGLIMLDIDNFKQINDRYGHAKGDEVLKELAKTLKESLRKYDLISRYGGEEFAVFIFDEEFEKIKKVAENIRKKIESIDISPKFTISLGVAYSKKSYDYAKLVENADRALYRAKNMGKNRVEINEVD